MPKALGIGGVFFKSADPNRIREHGGEVMTQVERSEFGAFGWAIDPDRNKVELWQPPAASVETAS